MTTIDFSTGFWVDTDRDGFNDYPALSVRVDLNTGTYTAYSDFNRILDATSGSTAATDAAGTNGKDYMIAKTTSTFSTLRGLIGDDQLFGAGGVDFLDGGEGVDIMTGGASNDVYTVDHVGDRIIEAAGAAAGAADIVVSYVISIDLTSALYANVEYATLSGSAHLNLSGTGGDNWLFGNNGDNVIDGRAGNDTLVGDHGDDKFNGGIGADAMSGGTGNDTYFVDAGGDLITEYEASVAIGGYDRIYTSISYTMPAYSEVLVLMGAAVINGTGLPTANFLYGSTGANVLRALGGNDRINGIAGNDTIYGGLGNDQIAGGTGLDKFVFDTALSSTTNLDVITDFVAADDVIHLENAIFTGLGAATGAMAASRFWASATGTAHDADDRIVYNTTNGALYYDSNGNAAGGATIFAILATKPTITAADFVVI